MSAQVPASDALVFLLDVDNTLLDNDRLKEDIAGQLEQLLGMERSDAFWRIYEQVRTCEDYVDYPETVKEWTAQFDDLAGGEALNRLLDSIDFPSYLFPHALDTLQYLRTIGTAVVLSDGDQVFQPKKIERSGIKDAVDGVLIYIHKEQELPRVFARYPADHYVMVDDKPRILAALEECCASTFTTVFVRQGKYAADSTLTPPPDIAVPHIADLRGITREEFLSGQARARA